MLFITYYQRKLFSNCCILLQLYVHGDLSKTDHVRYDQSAQYILDTLLGCHMDSFENSGKYHKDLGYPNI